MNIVIIGTGYVGLVTGACLADLGNKVTCVDIDKEKIKVLSEGKIPFYEPGLVDLVKKNFEKGNLDFTTSLTEKIKIAEVVFLAVGTPPKENGEADLKYVYKAAEEIGKNLDHYVVVVNKSTVPVGTGKKVKEMISQHYNGDFDVVSNPEFLREGSAIKDFTEPDRIVIGVESEKAKKTMDDLYKDFNCPKLFTNIESSEMIKYASNAFLATKISFINEIANVCENIGADVEAVAEGMGLDKRIGKSFLKAGLGYGGSCFPKDVRALHQIAGIYGYPFQLLSSVIEVNNSQRWHFFQKIKKVLGGLENKTIGIWGLAFKPNTDDIRESIALEIINRLIEEGAKVKVYDPQAMEIAKEKIENIEFCDSYLDASKDVDALLIITEWDEFKNADLKKVKKLMKNPVIFDGRNVYNPKEMNELGFEYFCIGRSCYNR